MANLKVIPIFTDGSARESDNAAAVRLTDLGPLLLFRHMGKVPIGYAFNPAQARRVAAELLLAAKLFEDAKGAHHG